jgi:AmiR/NasT family two-component response regulator
MVIAAKLLVDDRVLDQAWRGGVGVAKAAAHAKEISESLEFDAVMGDAKTIVSERHTCSPDEAMARLVFVSQRTHRRLRDIAHEVVASAAAERQELIVRSPRLYRFTL